MNEIILQTLKKMRTDYGGNEMIIFAQDSDLQVVANELEKAINYTRCSTELCDYCDENQIDTNTRYCLECIEHLVGGGR